MLINSPDSDDLIDGTPVKTPVEETHYFRIAMPLFKKGFTFNHSFYQNSIHTFKTAPEKLDLRCAATCFEKAITDLQGSYGPLVARPQGSACPF